MREPLVAAAGLGDDGHDTLAEQRGEVSSYAFCHPLGVYQWRTNGVPWCRLIEHWVGAFYKTCVPTRMVGGAYLFTGIIGARFGDGVTFVARSNCTRRTLRRPVGGELIGSTCSVETGVVEDFAASEQRYALAKLLGVPEVRFP